MDWFLYDNGLRHEKVKAGDIKMTASNFEALHHHHA